MQSASQISDINTNNHKPCLNSSVLKRSVFVDISKRNVASFDDGLYFVGKFTLTYDPVKVNAFSKQFLHYQMLNDHDISNSVWQNACNYYDEKAKYYKCYVLWRYTGEMKNWLGSINLISCSKLRK